MLESNQQDAQDDIVWIASVPLPLIGLGVDQCICGQRFWLRKRRERYELHYRRTHEREHESSVHVGVPRSKAKRIYDLVNADVEDVPPERTR